jgi:hypothetical protein
MIPVTLEERGTEGQIVRYELLLKGGCCSVFQERSHRWKGKQGVHHLFYTFAGCVVLLAQNNEEGLEEVGRAADLWTWTWSWWLSPVVVSRFFGDVEQKVNIHLEC